MVSVPQKWDVSSHQATSKKNALHFGQGIPGLRTEELNLGTDPRGGMGIICRILRCMVAHCEQHRSVLKCRNYAFNNCR